MDYKICSLCGQKLNRQDVRIGVVLFNGYVAYCPHCVEAYDLIACEICKDIKVHVDCMGVIGNRENCCDSCMIEHTIEMGI